MIDLEQKKTYIIIFELRSLTQDCPAVKELALQSLSSGKDRQFSDSPRAGVGSCLLVPQTTKRKDSAYLEAYKT